MCYSLFTPTDPFLSQLVVLFISLSATCACGWCDSHRVLWCAMCRSFCVTFIDRVFSILCFTTKSLLSSSQPVYDFIVSTATGFLFWTLFPLVGTVTLGYTKDLMIQEIDESPQLNQSNRIRWQLIIYDVSKGVNIKLGDLQSNWIWGFPNMQSLWFVSFFLSWTVQIVISILVDGWKWFLQ